LFATNPPRPGRASSRSRRCDGRVPLRVGRASGRPTPFGRSLRRARPSRPRPGVGHHDTSFRETLAVDFLARSELTGRLRGLVILLDEKITPDHAREADVLIDASEFGLALEVLADWLTEDKAPLSDELRADFD